MSKPVKKLSWVGSALSLGLGLVVSLSALLPVAAAPLESGGTIHLNSAGAVMDSLSNEQKMPAQTVDGKPYQITRTVINAAPADVFSMLIDYRRSGLLFNNLTKSEVLSRDENSKTSNVSFSLRGIMNLFSFDYVLSIKENFPSTIEFHRLSGAFKRNEGYWELLPLENGRRTEVVYAKYIDAGSIVPPQVVAKQVHDSTLAVVGNLKKVVENPGFRSIAHG